MATHEAFEGARKDRPYNIEGSPLLEVRHLNVDYLAASGTVHAVTDVSFSLRRGEILGLAGESGSGKSTLAYAITRLLRPPAMITGGEIRYYPREEGDAIDLLRLSPAKLRSIRWNELAIVFQSAMNALNPVMTIGAQISDVLRAHRPHMGSMRANSAPSNCFNWSVSLPIACTATLTS